MPQNDLACLCSDIIAYNARSNAKGWAVICEDQRLNWEQCNQQTNRFANALHALGLLKGQKVCIFMTSSLQSFVAFWGIIKAGCVVVPVNTMLDRESFVRLVNVSDSVAIFADAGQRSMVESARHELRNIAPDRYFSFGFEGTDWRSAEGQILSAQDHAPRVEISLRDSMTIIYTSGTTGEPKGIEHAHYGRLNYLIGFSMALSLDRYSVAICSTPVFATGTWMTMFPTMCHAGTVVIVSKFSAQAVLSAIQEHRGTHAFMVPAQFIALLQSDIDRYDLSSMKVICTSGQSIPKATYDALREVMPQAKICEVYGATEGFSTVAFPEDLARGKLGTVGKATFFDDIRVIDPQGVELAPGEVGEIVATGIAMMKGYYGRPDMTAAASWISPAGKRYIRSGDLGKFDEDGFLYCVGRLKDMIKSGGINVYAVDIEEVVMRHPDVKEAAVVGVPHPKWVETPIAVVVPKSGHAIDQDQFMAWVNERLSKYQRITAVVVREDMPRATYGKVQKKALREEYAAATFPFSA